MAPKLHLIRHAQGYHNLGPEYWHLADPLLTEEGKRQCLELSHNFSSEAKVDLIVASPMRRAIYTGIEAFGSVLGATKGNNIIALPSLQELSDFPCDIGSELENLRTEVVQNNLPVDLSFVEKNWFDKSGKYKPTLERIQDRAREARLWLKKRSEKEIVVITHGGFLHFLTEDWEDGCKYEATGWANVECRTYEFIPRDGGSDTSSPNDAPMQETSESRQRRGKHDSRLSLDCQRDLCNTMLQAWAKQGYPISSAQ